MPAPTRIRGQPQASSRGRLADRGISGGNDASLRPEIPRSASLPRDDTGCPSTTGATIEALPPRGLTRYILPRPAEGTPTMKSVKDLQTVSSNVKSLAEAALSENGGILRLAPC